MHRVPGSAAVVHGDALHLPLPDGSVDLVVTSPPYWALRSYTDGGEHYTGQIGSEATPREFVDALLTATEEMVRVLKPGGSIFVNLGDKYNSAASGQNGTGTTNLSGGRHDRMPGRGSTYGGLPPKSLIGLPWRYAIRCVDDLGLILRSEIVWEKPNGMPESVTDRVRRSHETWFHFTREPRYFAAMDEIRQEHKPGQHAAALSFNRPGRGTALGQTVPPHRLGRGDDGLHPLGALPGSVWEIASQPFKVPAHLGVDHYAAFPVEWPLRLILGWSPSGICTACNEGRRPVVERQAMVVKPSTSRLKALAEGGAQRASTSGTMVSPPMARVIGETCACSEPTAPTHPAVVLDPFGGTGTTALAAKVLGRRGVTVDASRDYCRIAEWRVSDPSEIDAARARARVHGVVTGLTDTDDLGLLSGLDWTG